MCRFGIELFEYIFQRFGARLEILDSNEYEPNEELADGLLSIVTVFKPNIMAEEITKKKLVQNQVMKTKKYITKK